MRIQVPGSPTHRWLADAIAVDESIENILAILEKNAIMMYRFWPDTQAVRPLEWAYDQKISKSRTHTSAPVGARLSCAIQGLDYANWHREILQQR